MKFNEEFQVGNHQIGWLSSNFTDAFKESDIVSVMMPTFQKLGRPMSDYAIESELKPGICTTGDVLAFLDGAPQECKDGWANLFYFPSFVVRVHWYAGSGEWGVDAWGRVGLDWYSGGRVFSSATDKRSVAEPSASDVLTLESLHLRLSKIEKIIHPDLLK